MEPLWSPVVATGGNLRDGPGEVHQQTLALPVPRKSDHSLRRQSTAAAPLLGTTTAVAFWRKCDVLLSCYGSRLVVRLARASWRLRFCSWRTARFSAAVWPPKRATVLSS